MILCRLAVATAVTLGAPAAPLYRVVDLGTFSPTDINNRGVIAGSQPRDDGLDWIAATWSAGNVNVIGALPGGAPSSRATAISDSGLVVGTSSSQTASPWGGWLSRQHAFIYNGTTIAALPGRDGDHSTGAGVNDAGVVVGTAGGNWSDGAVWRSGPWPEILSGYTGAATAINNAGQIAGYHSTTSSTGTYVSFVLSGGVYTYIPSHRAGSYDSAIANSINEAGEVVGHYRGDGPYFRSFLWSNGQRTDIGTIGTLDVVARDINNRGQVVGYSATLAQASGFIWDSEAGIRDINTMVMTAGWHITNAYAINDTGQIVGYGTFNGVGRGVLLEPVPEPSSISLAVIGLGCAALVRLTAGKRRVQ